MAEQQDLARVNQQMQKNAAAGATVETVYLDPKVSWDSCSVLNLNPLIKNIRPFMGGNVKANCLLSNDDAELLINYEFSEVVHLEGIELFAANPPAVANTARPPRTLYIFKDQVISFEDTEDLEPEDADENIFVYQMTEQDELDIQTKEVVVSLPKSRFRSTHKLTIFIQANTSGDNDVPTFFNLMRVFGKPSGYKGIDSWEPCKS